MNTRLVIIAMMVFAVILGFAYAMRLIKKFEITSKETKKNEITKTAVLYEKSESWGPCPPNETCTRQIIIKNDGNVSIIEENTHDEILPEEIHAELVQTIKDTKIMTRRCKGGEITDYSAKINISLDGETRELTYPECEDEIEEIDAVISKYIHL